MKRSMAARHSLSTTEDELAFIATRVFDALQANVWKRFTELDRMKYWWEPKGFTGVSASMDFRSGGIYQYGLRASGGSTIWGEFVYREIIRPARVVLVNSSSDEAGNLTRHPMNPTWRIEMLSTFLLGEQGRTTVTIKWVLLDTDETERKTIDAGRPGKQQGRTGTLDQLAEYLANA
jgi:uncharacterized protein YndB with AHSA1/START domain